MTSSEIERVAHARAAEHGPERVVQEWYDGAIDAVGAALEAVQGPRTLAEPFLAALAEHGYIVVVQD